jgi:hypothetical protein
VAANQRNIDAQREGRAAPAPTTGGGSASAPASPGGGNYRLSSVLQVELPGTPETRAFSAEVYERHICQQATPVPAPRTEYIYEGAGVFRLTALPEDKGPEAAAAARAGTLPNQPRISGSALPTEALLLADGDSPSGAGMLHVNADTYSRGPANQDALGLGDMGVLLPSASGSDEVQVACHGSIEYRAGQGIWITDLEWTPGGRLSVMDYGFFNPLIWFSEDKTVLAVQSVSLGTEQLAQGKPWPRFVTLSASDLARGPSARERMLRAFRKQNAAEQVKTLSARAPASVGLKGRDRVIADFERQIREGQR